MELLNKKHIDFWKRIFLGYICKQPDNCLDKDKWTNNCYLCSKLNSSWEENIIPVEDKDITLVPFYGENNKYKSVIDCLSPTALRKHPLVTNGRAQWYTYDTIIIGYTLKKTTVWRPIFSHKRENQLSRVRNSIKKNMVKRELSNIKKLYDDVIILICDYL